MKPLSKSQQKILDYIKECSVEGRVPSVREICTEIGLSSTSTVHHHLKALEEKGAVVKKISLPSTDYALSAYYIIACAEASSNLARYDGVKYGFRATDCNGLADMYEKTRSEGFGREVKRRIMLGTFVLSSGYYDAYYKRAKLLQKRIENEFNEAFSDVDVIITPTAPADDMATFKAKIDKLTMMKEAGMISDEEFNTMKAKLLSEIM